MKNKFIIFTLCFTIIFTNINLINYKSYAYNYEPLVVDGGVITAPMVATISSLAVASGIVLSSDDDIYDIARVFYHQNKENWDNVKEVFNACVTIGANKLITVGNDFLELVKNTFSTWFTDSPVKYNNYGIPIGYENSLTYSFTPKTSYSDSEVVFSITPGVYSIDIVLFGSDSSNTNISAYASFNGESFHLVSGSISNSVLAKTKKMKVYYNNTSNANFRSINFIFADASGNYLHGQNVYISSYESYNKNMGSFEIPYTPGSFNWDSVESKKENDSVALPVPGNLGTLVGQGSTDFWDNTDNLVGNGSISIPGVSNPSIDVTDDVFIGNPSTDIPGVDSPTIPNEGLWENIKDFIISLVVPSDTFWTDTFNSFRDNLSKNFPMLDMSGFDSLLVNGKPFPNIYAFGSIVVNGDIINSIVDWLRPIVAGFIMICLMFFNYRKVYKIIRNSEPFGNIAPGTSDFSTGLSSADIKQIVADAKRETERRTYRR